MNKKLLGLLTCSLVTTQSFGVELVKDINTRPNASSNFLWYGTTDIASGTLMVIADDIHGGELFFSDGTRNGTRLVRDIKPGADSSNITPPVTVAGIAYFFADDGVNGRELWRSDGTTAGTRIVSNIGAGSASAAAVAPDEPIVNANGVLFFSAFDAATGLQLWRSDGTNAGTYRLWYSDGTTAGTKLLADVNPGVQSFADPGDLYPVSSRLYFRAHRPDVGEELWSLNLSDPNANGDSATTTYGTAVSVTVLANDSDMDSTLNQASVQIVVAPASGTTTIDLATGAITYTPNANFSGTDRFSYRVSDPQNHASNAAFVDVIVKPQPITAAPGTAPTAPPVTPPVTPPTTPPATPQNSGGGGAMGVELWALVLAMFVASYSRCRTRSRSQACCARRKS